MIRTEKRNKDHNYITSILADYRNLKRIADIKSQRKEVMVPSMTDANGTAQHDRRDIADIFAECYRELYIDMHQNIGSIDPRVAQPHHDRHRLRRSYWRS